MDRNQSLVEEFQQAAGQLWNRRRHIVGLALLAAVVAAMISLAVPQVYRARATFLSSSPESNSFAAALANAGTPIPSGLLATPATPLDMFQVVLESRALGLGVVRSLDLVDAFAISATNDRVAEEGALATLQGCVRVAQKRSGMVSVEAQVPTPWLPFLHAGADSSAKELAASIANEMIRQLNIVLQERRSSSARNSRLYLETQMERNQTQLEVASDSLVAFQKRHATLSIDQQAQVTVQMLGTLQGQIVAKEIELDVIGQTRTLSSFEYQRANTELEALRSRYDLLLRGVPGSDDPMSALPDLAMELLRRTREVELQHTVHQLLTTQYYQALLEEARDTPTVDVLDEAVPPLGKYRPQRKLIVVLAFLGGAIVSSLWVLLPSRGSVARSA